MLKNDSSLSARKRFQKLASSRATLSLVATSASTTHNIARPIEKALDNLCFMLTDFLTFQSK